MGDPLHGLAEEYASALARFVAVGGEAARSQAYEIGRKAAAERVGLFDLVDMHHRALASIVAAAPGELDRHLATASQFVAELLSPFEMSLRGYHEANARLIAVNEELAAANKDLEAFSYSIAHDLRAPLRRIDGFTMVLLEDCADRLDASAREHLNRVSASARRMGELIDALLELSRTGRAELRRECVDVTAIAEGVGAQLRQADPRRDVDFVVEHGLVANGDPRLLQAVLENLIGNAWKFTAKKPRARIEVGATHENSVETFFVRDNGTGFDMAYAKNLFGVFERLHADEFPGTGIGLATVQRIVSRHGGRVWAAAAVGQGATFCFTLEGEDHGGAAHPRGGGRSLGA